MSLDRLIKVMNLLLRNYLYEVKKMKNMNEKKLLVISSDGNDITFVDAARELGAYVICCDRYTDHRRSPAKELADEAWDIDYSDTATVAERCKKEHIDGVIAGYSEDRVLAACRISSAIGTPFYATEEQINITRNKRLFKELCGKYGVPTPVEYCHKLPMSPNDFASIKFPAIVKPSDNGGRRGITVCQTREQLVAAIEDAAELSKTGEVVVEEYLTGMELCAVYTLVDGEISLSCLNDKYPSEEGDGTSHLCDVVITPSRFHQRYISEVDGKIKALLSGIGARNGVANFQFIVSDDGIKAFEMGYRINGNDDYKVIRHCNGIDFSKMLVSYSLIGSMGETLEKDNPKFKELICTLCFYLHGGTIGKIDYSSLIGITNIFDISIHRRVGNIIPENGTNAQKLGMVKFTGNTIEDIIDTIHFIQQNLVVEDNRGQNMLLKPFNPLRLIEPPTVAVNAYVPNDSAK